MPDPVSYTHLDVYKRQVLDRHGFDSGGHRAHKITAAEIAGADLVLGFEPIHVSRMRAIAPEASHLALVCLLYTSRCV